MQKTVKSEEMVSYGGTMAKSLSFEAMVIYGGYQSSGEPIRDRHGHFVRERIFNSVGTSIV